MRRAEGEGIIGDRVDPFAGTPLALQREASPEAARPVARIEVTGAKQASREAIAPHLNALQAKVLTAIRAWGPCTRDLLAEQLAMNPSTLRPRVIELLNRQLIHVTGFTHDHPRRELLAVVPPSEEAR